MTGTRQIMNMMISASPCGIRSLVSAALRTATALMVFLALWLDVVICHGDAGSEPERVFSDLSSLSIEDLMDLEVTSVSRKTERVADAAAAVFVISGDDIRRSGATTIADALRMAPGLQVARIDASTWAVSSRGFNGRFSDKLLVLMDGRSVYTPLYSGVFWGLQDTLLEDIERIEVIRGPGATLWGANAVNGVINIITKNAADTPGGTVTAGSGTGERLFGGARYGAGLGEKARLRVYGKYFDRNNSVYPDGREAKDGWHAGRGGFRLDGEPTADDSFTLQGDLYDGRAGWTLVTPTLSPPYSAVSDYPDRFSGGNVLGRWTHEFSPSSDMTLQVYYDRTSQSIGWFREKRDTVDLDFQHRFGLGTRQEVLWGLGYRFTHDRINNMQPVIFCPDSRGDNLFTAFVQDDIILVRDLLRLTLGSKFERNDYSGFEIQPNVRLLWTPRERHTVWAAVSRAVRTPSRADGGIFFYGDTYPPGSFRNPETIPLRTAVISSPDFQSEELIAYELGYRVQPLRNLSFDLAMFVNTYDNLRDVEPLPPLYLASPTPHYLLPFMARNNMQGETWGVEAAADWKPLDWWRLLAAYTFLDTHMGFSQMIPDPYNRSAVEGRSPGHQFSLQSRMDLGRKVELDLWLRYVGRLPDLRIGSYLTLDARIAWKPVPLLEISLVGQNLFHTRQSEFKPEFITTVPTDVERGVYGAVTWNF